MFPGSGYGTVPAMVRLGKRGEAKFGAWMSTVRLLRGRRLEEKGLYVISPDYIAKVSRKLGTLKPRSLFSQCEACIPIFDVCRCIPTSTQFFATGHSTQPVVAKMMFREGARTAQVSIQCPGRSEEGGRPWTRVSEFSRSSQAAGIGVGVQKWKFVSRKFHHVPPNGRRCRQLIHVDSEDS